MIADPQRWTAAAYARLNTAMHAYQSLYRQLFALIMQGQQDSPEAEKLRREMDRLPGSDHQKTQWGQAVGAELYQRRLEAP